MDDDVDVLGPEWIAKTFALKADRVSRRTGVEPVATLVSMREVDPNRVAVLYLHGFVDYFFQGHVGRYLDGAGYQMYGLDLRDCGRSSRPGRPINDISDLSRYTEEIDRAVRELLAVHERVVMLGHSTGGLVAALWADARPGVLSALILNSPWLDLRGSTVEKTVGTWAIDAIGSVAPQTVVSHLGEFYGRALHQSTGGEWDYNLDWKSFDAPPVTAGFVRTVRRAHARVARGLWIDCPTLVLASANNGPTDRFHDGLLTADCILGVDDMERLAPQLGLDVSFRSIEGGAHDLALSPEPARSEYLDTVVKYLDGRLARRAVAQQTEPASNK